MKQEQYPPVSAKSIEVIGLILWAMIGGLALSAVFFYVMHEKKEILFDFQDTNFLLSAGITIASVVAAEQVYKSLRDKISAAMPLEEKLSKIQSANLVRFAILEGAAFLIILALQHDRSFFVFPAIIILYMIFAKPSKEKLMQDMQLSNAERMKLHT